MLLWVISRFTCSWFPKRERASVGCWFPKLRLYDEDGDLVWDGGEPPLISTSPASLCFPAVEPSFSLSLSLSASPKAGSDRSLSFPVSLVSSLLGLLGANHVSGPIYRLKKLPVEPSTSPAHTGSSGGRPRLATAQFCVPVNSWGPSNPLKHLI